MQARGSGRGLRLGTPCRVQTGSMMRLRKGDAEDYTNCAASHVWEGSHSSALPASAIGQRIVVHPGRGKSGRRAPNLLNYRSDGRHGRQRRSHKAPYAHDLRFQARVRMPPYLAR